MSKGLEALKEIKNFIENECVNGYEQDISIIEKELEALEIIKEKKVDISVFLRNNCLEHYNMTYRYVDLTQEEYDLLKEVLL